MSGVRCTPKLVTCGKPVTDLPCFMGQFPSQGMRTWDIPEKNDAATLYGRAKAISVQGRCFYHSNSSGEREEVLLSDYQAQVVEAVTWQPGIFWSTSYSGATEPPFLAEGYEV